jgi:hypothetical protein
MQVRSPERYQNQQVLSNHHNFFFAHQNLVRPIELQRRHTKLLEVEILDPKVQKFKDTSIMGWPTDHSLNKGLKGMSTWIIHNF